MRHYFPRREAIQELARLLKNKRILIDKKSRDVAKSIDISPASFSDFENGKTNKDIKLFFLIDLAKELQAEHEVKWFLEKLLGIDDGLYQHCQNLETELIELKKLILILAFRRIF